MIQLERVRTEQAIPSRFRGEKLKNLSRELVDNRKAFLQNPDGKKQSFPSKWGVAKDQLLAETHDKCGYCESPTAVVAYGDVEHYRPKSVYWWQAYCVDNYVASCTLCNGRFKGAKFPRTGRKWPSPPVKSNSTEQKLVTIAETLVPDPLDSVAVAAFIGRHQSEQANIPNPYLEDPASLFAWLADAIEETVTLIPVAGNKRSSVVVKAVEEALGLNREQLLTERYTRFKEFYRYKFALEHRASLSAEMIEVFTEGVAELVEPAAGYAGMMRFFDALGGPADWERAGFYIPAE